MELLFGFLIILKGSIKLLQKNPKPMASIAAVSIAFSSILLLLFSHFADSVIHVMIKRLDSRLKLMVLLGASEVAFLLLFFTLSDLFVLATTFASAMSYTSEEFSSQDLLSTVARTWTHPPNRTLFRESRKSSVWFVFLMAASISVLTTTHRTNLTLLCTSVFILVAFLGYQMYSSVVRAVAVVVAVVEEGCEGKQAMERGEYLVKGHRHYGFLLNLLHKVLLVVSFVGFWMAVGNKRAGNLRTYGLFFVNVYSVARICMSAAYTVFYFHCKKRRGEEILSPAVMQN